MAITIKRSNKGRFLKTRLTLIFSVCIDEKNGKCDLLQLTVMANANLIAIRLRLSDLSSTD
jgi:hypothetical protein